MKSVSGKALCKIVERYGWELKRITGSHNIYFVAVAKLKKSDKCKLISWILLLNICIACPIFARSPIAML
jgi:hypothetical protein